MCVPGSQKPFIRGLPPSFNNPNDAAQWGDVYFYTKHDDLYTKNDDVH